MTRLTILEYPDPRLRTKASPVASVDAPLRDLIDDMFETMYDAPGIGLAAIQVGSPLRLFIIDAGVAGRDPTDAPLVFINPEIVAISDEAQTGDEGCLSFPGIFVPVDETVQSFEALVDGELDEIPEQAFFMVGGVEEAIEKARELEKVGAES